MRRAGLPPGPICSMGVLSVKAVLNPAPIDAIYFVADRTGYHRFNAKFSEHLKAKTDIQQRARRAAADKANRSGK